MKFPRSYSKKFFSTGFTASSLNVFKSSKLKSKPKTQDLVFGKYFTDHMLTIEYANGKWGNPNITQYNNLSLDPASSVLHYGMECFEGLKAYKDSNEDIRLFRPDMNMKRLSKSGKRLALPAFDDVELLECIKKLVKLDGDWIPKERGYSLYIRPTFIGTQNSLGVGPSTKALLYCICSPVGPYYKTGFNAVSLLADPSMVRAWPGGCGDAKVGGNYAPTISPQIAANEAGFQQILWLFPAGFSFTEGFKAGDHLITEVGTMNCFVFWERPDGVKELITPPLDGTILPGVTRDSILVLAKELASKGGLDGKSRFEVNEKYISMREIISASRENRLLEMFGSGTAAIVSPIKLIRYVEHLRKNTVDIKVPLDSKNKNSEIGPLAKYFSEKILSIQYGDIKHSWSVKI